MDWGTFFTLFPLAVAIGFIASLLGLGGGVFMTPLLLLGGFVATQPDAAGTSVAAVVFTGISASIAYFKRKVIDYRIGLMFMPTAIAGVFLGKWIIQSVDPSWLTIAFGVFLLYPMTMMLLGKTPKDAKARLKGWSSGVRYYVLVGIIGLAAGVATKLFGIGGGTVFVPSLVVLLGIDIVTAVATSLFVMVPIALISAITSQAEPASWMDVGGEGSVQYAKAGILVIGHREQIHQKVLRLLETYRSALRSSKPRQPRGDDPNEVTTVYYRLHANVASDLVTMLPQLVRPDSWKSPQRASIRLRPSGGGNRLRQGGRQSASFPGNSPEPTDHPSTEHVAVVSREQLVTSIPGQGHSDF